MEVIKLSNKVIYKPAEGKLVKFSGFDKVYEEIVVSEEHNDIEEVDG